MSRKSDDAEYSIAAVSKLTGVSCHALRVWERRYDFPIPHRSNSGHRRYSSEQVRALRAIAQRAQLGRQIGELIAEHRAGQLGSVRPAEPEAAASERPPEAGLVDRLVAGELADAEALYRRTAGELEPCEIVARVIGPAWIDAGERWFRHEISAYHERVVSEFLQRKLAVLIDAARQSNAHPSRTLMTGTVQGDRHVGGVLMLSLLMERAGWKVLNLGVDLPVREFRAAVEHWRPDALALSFILSRNIKKRFHEIREIVGLPIFVGGRSILNYQGLARRHGLIPLPGPVDMSVPQLLAEFERWNDRQLPRSAC
jgi:MerR family transcriptional regulator, light-induced transcriptional regulator